MVVIEIPVNEKIEKQLDSLNDKFEELKAKMSDLRKNGKDTRIAELLTLDFAPRLKMAKVTYEKEDVQKVRNLIQDIKNELKESEEGSDFAHATDLIKEAYEYLRNGRLKEASIAYSVVIKIYKKLPKDLKRTIYIACLDIKKKIEKIKVKKSA